MESRHFMLDKVIGKGGFGSVYTLSDRPDLVVKISLINNSCRTWSNEYDKIVDVRDKIIDSPFYSLLKSVKLIDVKLFFQEDNTCYMVMERVYRPIYGDCNPETYNTDSPTLQAQFGVLDVSLVHKGRGEFIGLKQILEYLDSCPQYGSDTLENLSKELGIMMGLMHFIAKNNGIDVEVFLGRRYSDDKLRLFIADFDLTNTFDEYDKDTISNLVWSLSAFPYFPSKETEVLFEYFSLGYKSVADSVGLLHVAEAILEEYDI